METTQDKDQIRKQILEFQVEHRDLDHMIEVLTQRSSIDEFQLRRIKKRKLQIKDKIILLQMQLEPDILA